MGVTRLEFIKGALVSLGFGALGGWRLFAAPPGLRRARKPNLVFGVLSDTHLCSRPFAGRPYSDWPVKYFAAALEYFKSLHVDAVVHCGDLAHRGRVRELEFHAEIWRDVFGKHGPTKLFVAGNHEFRADGAGRKLIDDGMAANWERIWGEAYDEVWHKEVKGCHFFGRHWGADEGRLVDLVKKHIAPDAADKGAKPFFVLTHRILGRETRMALGGYRNALGFFGHWHHSAANWREIYCADGLAPFIQVPPCHPHGEGSLAHGKAILKIPIEKNEFVGNGRQGYVVRVYDDMLTIERREFGEGGSLGPEWVMPLVAKLGTGNGEREGHPFSYDELKKVIGKPQFPKGAKLSVECRQCENVAKSNVANGQLEIGTGNGNNSTMATISIKIPLADGNPDSRVYVYEVVVIGDEGGRKLHKAVYATGCNLGVGHEPNGGMTTLDIPKSELPPGKTLTFAVRPLTSLGTFGKPIATTFKT